MRYVIIPTRLFMAKASRLRLTLEDVRAIENEIMEGPKDWPVIRGTNGVRKMRFAPARSGSGKSGGVRICYLVVEAACHVHLLTLYPKSEQGDLSPTDRRILARLVDEIRNEYR